MTGDKTDIFLNISSSWAQLDAEVKTFYLMLFDQPLLKFNAVKRFNEYSYEVLITSKENSLKHLFPLGMQSRYKRGADEIKDWIDNRVIQTNRRHLKDILQHFNLSDAQALDLLVLNHGASLNDCYWLKGENENITFEEVNLFTNKFEESVSSVALIGKDGKSSVGGNINSPEVTTDGMLAKCWRKDDKGTPYLLKRSSRFYSLANREPLSECLASMIADRLELPHVKYELDTYHGYVCSRCDCFTNIDVSYSSMHSVLYATDVDVKTINTMERMKSIVSGYFKQSMLRRLDDLCVYDFIIENEDRHMKNFGILHDSRTRTIIGMAPIFDNGMSLLFNKSISELEILDVRISQKSLLGSKNNASTCFEVLRRDHISIIKNLQGLVQDVDFMDSIYRKIVDYFNLNNFTEDMDYETDLIYNKIVELLRSRYEMLLYMYKKKF